MKTRRFYTVKALIEVTYRGAGASSGCRLMFGGTDHVYCFTQPQVNIHLSESGYITIDDEWVQDNTKEHAYKIS